MRSTQTACGEVLWGGFSGTELPTDFASVLKRQERGGVVLFRRNVASDLADVARLNAVIFDASRERPAFIAVDQEGGRVARLGAPALRVPPMRRIGELCGRAGHGVELAARIGRVQARELAALGFAMNFSPVLDVDTQPSNPIIGDRSFASDATQVAECATAYIRAFEGEGILACGKHFPGHGDTTKDSHLDLPVVERAASELDRVELTPFRAAIKANVAALMSAHVVYTAYDATLPATLSHNVATDMLRRDLAYGGVLISDDLEMKAIADRMTIEEASVTAINAGCDVLLICSNEDLQHRAYAALVKKAEMDSAFRGRIEEANCRIGAMRKRVRWQAPVTDATALTAIFSNHEKITLEREMFE